MVSSRLLERSFRFDSKPAASALDRFAETVRGINILYRRLNGGAQFLDRVFTKGGESGYTCSAYKALHFLLLFLYNGSL